MSDTRREVYEAYGEVTEDGIPRRGIVVLDSGLTVRYKWIAEDNWDEWRIEPLEAAIETVESLAPACGSVARERLSGGDI